jgi:hypothetical protein
VGLCWRIAQVKQVWNRKEHAGKFHVSEELSKVEGGVCFRCRPRYCPLVRSREATRGPPFDIYEDAKIGSFLHNQIRCKRIRRVLGVETQNHLRSTCLQIKIGNQKPTTHPHPKYLPTTFSQKVRPKYSPFRLY